MSRCSTRPTLALLALSSLACSHHRTAGRPSPTPAPLAPGIIYGIVRALYSEEPIKGAQVTVDGTAVAGFADSVGRYWLGPLRPGTYNLHVRMITYTPTTIVATVPDTGRLHLDLHLSYPGAGPPVDSSLVFSIWATVASQYHPHEAEHIRAVTGLTGVAVDSSNVGARPLVLMLARDVQQNAFARHLLDSLVVTGFASAACEQDNAINCPGEVFTTFLSLSQPRQQASDEVAVAVEETALNPDACRRHRRGFGGFHSVTLKLSRRGNEWSVEGPIGVSLSGSVVCGN